ncbi:hypothetical protein DTO045G8_4648 [Paecilomyces variotii]|nr:hypothetical protein DTO045G8_4648 [Paecilomyces variotii]
MEPAGEENRMMTASYTARILKAGDNLKSALTSTLRAGQMHGSFLGFGCNMGCSTSRSIKKSVFPTHNKVPR